MTTLQIISWTIAQTATIGSIVWGVIHWAYRNRIEALKEQVERVDYMDRYWEMREAGLKAEHEKGLRDKDNEKLRDLKRIEELTIELKEVEQKYQDAMARLQMTPYASGSVELEPYVSRKALASAALRRRVLLGLAPHGKRPAKQERSSRKRRGSVAD